jgi:hypothetical protein
MVIAKFVAVFPLFDIVQGRLRHLDGRIEPSDSGIPWRWLGLDDLSCLSWSAGGFGLKWNW